MARTFRSNIYYYIMSFISDETRKLDMLYRYAGHQQKDFVYR